ncbi:ABC transporter ATP-binding protein [Halobacillus sp. HZG1]|uniref:ABC transporter ATP-binding protein n=1 Tax=Halobacillus sp. HZG1 TaxID=3111769 RepID=UPI002DBA2FF6|nr:ABC transporter ATP-binding protein [Halobacillus sp. HZG1]MEC3883281.1 ABC transporter ATP-binding protein [Halobacillus sp. HZG1]
MIHLKNLTKTFGKENAVKNITFDLSQGKCVALLGPNGAGKTTTLKMIAGLMYPSSGQVELSSGGGDDIRKYIGYLPQHPQFHNWMTGKEFLHYVARLSRISKLESIKLAEELVERVGIADAKNRKISSYSGGMKQRLGIAQAMIHKPSVLLLDEPVSALDPIGRRDVLNLMEELKQEATLLYSTHILSDAEEASDEILLMHKGEIVESGSLQDVKERHQVDKVTLRLEGNVQPFKEKLETLPFVTHTDVQKQKIHVYVQNVTEARDVLLELVTKEQWPLLFFEVGQTTLEDLFMKVVNEHAMDDHL